MKPHLEKTVYQWLIEEDRYERELTDDELDEVEAEFAYELRTGEFNHIVFQPRGQDKLVLKSAMTIDDVHLGLLYERMTEYERTAFLWDLRLGMLWKNTLFNIIREDGRVEVIEFTRVLQGGNVTKSIFEDAISEIHQAKLYVSWNLRREEDLKKVQMKD